jgi:acetyltransferase
MMDLCRSLADYPAIQPKSSRQVAILTMSGAAGIVSADFLEQHGLSVADLDGSTIEALKQIYPPWMPASNPVDLWPAVELHGRRKAYQAAFQAVFADPKVDAVLFHSFVGGSASSIDVSGPAEMARQSGKPLFGWLMGQRTEAHQFQMTARKLGVPVFGELYRAVECMGAVLSRQEMPQSEPNRRLSVESIYGNDRLKKLLTVATDTLNEYQSKQILDACRIPVVEEKIIPDSAGLREAVREYGVPLVLKGLLPGETHKTESGLVHTGISSAEEAVRVFAELRQKMAADGSVLLQKQVVGYPELIVGLIRDPQFGPCVMCGFGGILAEVLADSVFAAAPFNKSEALALIDRLKTQKLLNGFRGSIAVDRDALADILVRLGDLGAAFEQIKEIDINPLIVQEGRPIAVDATIIVDKIGE